MLRRREDASIADFAAVRLPEQAVVSVAWSGSS